MNNIQKAVIIVLLVLLGLDNLSYSKRIKQLEIRVEELAARIKY